MGGLYVAFLLVCLYSATVSADECYSVQCMTKGCLSDAINSGTAQTCTRPAGGYCQSVKQDMGSIYMETAGCTNSTDDTCIANMALYDFPDGIRTISLCCQTNLCNTGANDKPSGLSCNSITCNSTGCLGEALQEGVVAYCPQTSYGCATTIVSDMIITTCSPTPCFSMTLSDLKVECCTGDVCQTPTGYTTSGPATSSTPTSSTSTSSTPTSSTSTSSTPTSSTSTSSTPTSSTGTSSTTDTSGAAILGHVPYLIYFLVVFLISFDS